MGRRLLATGVILAVLLVLGGTLSSRAEEESDAQEVMVELVTTHPLPLQDFLRAVGKVAKIPFLWDPGARELAHAEFVAAQNLQAPRDDFFDVVRSILASYELALVPIGPPGYQVYRVTAIHDLAGSPTAQPLAIELGPENAVAYRHAHGLLVTTTLRTEHLVDLVSARTALLAHATRDGVGRVAVLKDLPGFAVTDFAPAVVVMHDTLRRIDVPPAKPPAPVRVTVRIDLEHANAEEAEAGLAAHLGANLPLPGRDGLTPALRETPPLGLRILADERTNALLVSGSPERVAAVQEAASLLDVPAEQPSTWIHVVRLKHRQAAPTARSLRELAKGKGVLHGGDDAPPTTIVADVQANAILVEATPRVFEQLKALLEQLDVPGSDDEAR